MRDVLHSCAPLPLIPPTPFSHKGRRGSLGVLMPETGDGTQGLTKKSTPVRRSAPGARASGAQAGETPARRPGVTVALRLGARASCPRRRDAGETPALRAGSWVRAPPARISAAPALGARASGAHASEDAPPARRRQGRPQRLPWVRAPLARMLARIRLQHAGGQGRPRSQAHVFPQG